MIRTLQLPTAIAAILCTGMACAHQAQPTAKPEVFAPGVISGPASDDAPVFTPDGRTVLFFRSNHQDYDIMESHREGARWSPPRVVSFSGQWRDLEPAMAPDGSYLVFASSRPFHGGTTRPDGHWGGKSHPGRGGNLWRVDRKGGGWSAPVRLPDIVNRTDATFSPGIARDGTLYYMAATAKNGDFQIWRTPIKGGQYQTPELLPFCVHYECMDGTIAPDQSFIVFSSGRPPAAPQGNDLFIAFRDGMHWGEPIDLGPEVAAFSPIESRLGPDGHTLYFSSNHVVPPAFPKNKQSKLGGLCEMQEWNDGTDNIWKIDLTPWIARHVAQKSQEAR